MTSATKEKPATAAAEHAPYPSGFDRASDVRQVESDLKRIQTGTNDARNRLLANPKSAELKEALLDATYKFRVTGRLINAGQRDFQALTKDETGFRQPHQAAQLAGIRGELKVATELQEELREKQEAARQELHAIQEKVLAGG